MRYPGYLEEEIVFPDFYRVKVKNTSMKINFEEKLKKELRDIWAKLKIKKGESVAVCVGSRGIRDISVIAGVIISFLKKKGVMPFIVPAMGSHGGATPDGQKKVLENLGITEESMEARIVSDLSVEEIGKVFGDVPVYFSKDCLDADHSICINRIRPHTKFKGKTESGLLKMISVGMGKHKGAQTYHNMALKYGFEKLLVKMAGYAAEKSNLAFGVALVEDFYGDIMDIRAVETSDIYESEKELLKTAKKFFPKLPVKALDALIVGTIGKEISGSGMDPNVTGRTFDYMEDDFSGELDVKRVAILSLSEKSGGNAIGLGNADIITGRVFKKMDYEVTTINALTSLSLKKAFIPVTVRDDLMAVKASLLTAGPYDPENSRIIFIKDTKSLETFVASSAVVKELQGAGIEFEKTELKFDGDGNLVNLF